MFNNITEDNFILYAAKAYDRPNCVKSEFDDDLKRFNYLNRLFTRYKKFGEIKERLIINHLIILNNVFGHEALVRLLFFKIHESHYTVLKTYLLFLNIMPDRIKGVRGKDIMSSSIHVDMDIVKILREIK